jgi:hypothetical protein
MKDLDITSAVDSILAELYKKSHQPVKKSSKYENLRNMLYIYNNNTLYDAYMIIHNVKEFGLSKNKVVNSAKSEYSNLKNSLEYSSAGLHDKEKLKNFSDVFFKYSEDLYNKLISDHTQDVQIYKEHYQACLPMTELLNLSDDMYISKYKEMQNIDKSLIGSDIQKIIGHAAINDKHELGKFKYALLAIDEQLYDGSIDYSEASQLLECSLDIFSRQSEEIYNELVKKIKDYRITVKNKQSKAKELMLDMLNDSSDLENTINDCLGDINAMQDTLAQYSNTISKLVQNENHDTEDEFDDSGDELTIPIMENVIINMLQLNNIDLPEYNPKNDNMVEYLKAFKTISLKMRRSLDFPKIMMNIVDESDIIIVPDGQKLKQYNDAICTVICIEDINSIPDDHNITDVIIDYASSFFDNEYKMIYEKFGKKASQTFIKLG